MASPARRHWVRRDRSARQTRTSRPIGTAIGCGGPPSLRHVATAGDGSAPAFSPALSGRSSTRMVSGAMLPTRPKRGARTTTSRRSRSSGLPDSSTWSGAPTALANCGASPCGTSCTSPSVIITTPARRCCGICAVARLSAANSRVPSSPAPGRGSPARITRRSRSGSPARRRRIAVNAVSVCCRRSPMLWLGDSSTTTTATSRWAERCSSISEGSTSAIKRIAIAIARQPRPGARRQAPKPRTSAPAALNAAIAGHGSIGAVARTMPLPFTGRAAPGSPARAPGPTCNCRSART